MQLNLRNLEKWPVTEQFVTIYLGILGNKTWRYLICLPFAMGQRHENPSEISGWAIWGYLPIAIILGVAWMHGFSLLAQPGGSKLKLDTGQEIFEAGCVSWHDPDSKGQSQ